MHIFIRRSSHSNIPITNYCNYGNISSEARHSRRNLNPALLFMLNMSFKKLKYLETLRVLTESFTVSCYK